MINYELMAIISGELSEADAKSAAKTSIDDLLTSQKAKLTWQDFWGARGFAYIIKKQKWGYYYVVRFEAEPEVLAMVRDDLNLDKSVVRFLISKVDKSAPAPRAYKEVKAEWEAQEKAQEKSKEKVQVGQVREKLTTIKEEEVPKESASEKPDASAKEAAPKEEPKPKAVAKPAPKPDTIDEKLDAMLEDSDS